MNETRFNLDSNESSSRFFGERISNFIKGLGAYFAVVFTAISILIVGAILSDSNTLQVPNLLVYLMISVLLLFAYSVATTRTVRSSNGYKIHQIIKRFLDIVIAALLLYWLAPLLILLSITIPIESRGPIFFRTKRIGQFGRFFEMYRFRTMHTFQATESGHRRQPITRIGGFLHRFYLDELPTLLNVLNGEMSIVGPLPRLPENADETLDPEHIILTVRPGITGSWQVTDLPVNEMPHLDLAYVENWSLAQDLRIIFQTILIAMFGKTRS
jgi:lipopolysaccharide/colanic/teichoic acid biosynthesis glycosyltransferase